MFPTLSWRRAFSISGLTSGIWRHPVLEVMQHQLARLFIRNYYIYNIDKYYNRYLSENWNYSEIVRIKNSFFDLSRLDFRKNAQAKQDIFPIKNVPMLPFSHDIWIVLTNFAYCVLVHFIGESINNTVATLPPRPIQ